jgi:type VI secretion system secreted protein VgrG
MATPLGFTQTDRALKIDSPLGADKLLLRAIAGQEAISQLFRFQLDLISEDDAIPFDGIVGKNVTLHLEIADGERTWNGFISRFSQGARDDRFSTYHAEMVPWLWFLTRTADCRIFQNLTVPDIVQKIFKDLGFQDYKLQLYSSYRKRDYCVQYRETDFNFVSRLMEEEGIYYFFQDENGKHTMVLADDAAAHQMCPGQPKARCEQVSGGWHPDDVITELRVEQEFRPSAWAHTDYNFETPSTNLMVTVQEQPKYEIYDYPGIYPKRSDGDKLAKMRLQETVALKSRVAGQSTCRNFNTGYLVEITDHYRKDINQKWLLTAVYHQATMGGSYETGTASEGLHYTNTFECIPSSVPFRPPRMTPKPHVQGCQTAVVVGPGGEEIYTDKYGRVKVQFFWDREGKRNESSSCWMRVSYPWAGKSWGGIHIPRIGQEVIVDFVEGDPDEPIIVGRVYNAEETPPWGLPGKAVISGFKSDSTKGGGGYNEFSMDDTKGNELINVHAQFDQQKKVEHDERVDVGRDRTEHVGRDEQITIDHDRTEKVGHDEKILIQHDKTEVVNHDRALQVDHDKTELVHHNKSIQIDGDHSEKVSGSMAITVGRTLTESVLINYAESVGGAMELTVGGALAITAGGLMAETVGGVKTEAIGGDKTQAIGGNKSVTIGKDLNETVTGAQTTKVIKDLTENVTGKHREEVTKEYMLQAKKVQITADDEIHLKTGSAEIILKKSGDISVKGNKISVTGDGDVIIKGSKVKAN